LLVSGIAILFPQPASGMTTSCNSDRILKLCYESTYYTPKRVNLLMWSYHWPEKLAFS